MGESKGAVLGAAAAYVGAVAGAGLLSGRESAQFFLPFGQSGIWGACGSLVLFALAGGSIFDYARKIKAVSHQDVLQSVVGPWAGSFLDLLICVFLFLAVGVMLAGAGALLLGTYGLHARVGTLFLALMCMTILASGPEGFIKANAGMVLALLGILMVVLWQGGWLVPSYPVTTPVLEWGFTPHHWILATVNYAAYNVGLSLSLLTALGRTLHSQKQAWLAGVLGGAALGVTVALVTRALAPYTPQALFAPVPMLLIVERAAGWTFPAYVIGMVLALATTAIGSAFALQRRLSSRLPKVERWAGITIVALALPISTYGFMPLVRVVYPLFGYLVCAVVTWTLLRRLNRLRRSL